MEKEAKSLSGQKVKRAGTDFIALETKWCRQFTCGNWKETEKGMTQPWPISRFGNVISGCCSSFNEFMEKLLSQTGSYQTKLFSSISSIKGNAEDSVNCAPGSSCGVASPRSIDLNLPQFFMEFEYQIPDQNDAPGSSHGNESPLLIDLNQLPQVSSESKYQIPEENDAPSSYHGKESLLLIDLNLPQVAPELEYQIPGKNDVPGSLLGNESTLLIDLNLPPTSQDLEYQILKYNNAPGSSRGSESILLIDLNLPQASAELENQIPEQNDVQGSSRGNESLLLMDFNQPQVCLELEYQIPEQNDPHLPNSSAKEVGLEHQDTDHSVLDSAVSEARLEQPPVVTSRKHSTRSRPPTTRALEALEHGYLTVKRRRKSRGRFH